MNHRAFLRDSKHNAFFIPGGQGGYVFSYAGDTLALHATVAGYQVKRAVYIEDMLYVIGEDKITVIDEATWKELKTLDL
jgi:inhibitor of cysteine peptidase